MFSRSLSLVRVARVAPRFQAVRCASGGHEVTVHEPSPRQLAIDMQATLDHITVPQGSWQQDYDRKQKKYNLNLAVNLIAFIGFWYIMYQTGALQFYWMPGNTKALDIFEKDEDEEY